MDNQDIATSTRHRGRRIRVGYAFALALAAVAPGVTATALRGETAQYDFSPSAESKRVIVALLPFEDRTGEPNLASWRYLAPGLVKDQLSHLKSLRLRSEGAVRYGLRQAGISPGDAVDPNHARAIGEHIEAQRVIWGSYSREDEQLRMEVRLLNVATGESSGPFVATGADGFDRAML